MGNFLFRTANYRRQKAIERQQRQTNALLQQQLDAQSQQQAVQGPPLSPDGRWWWDGRQWQPMPTTPPA